MPFLNFTWEVLALELSKWDCFGLGCCDRSLTHATCQWHTDASWNALPFHLFLTLIKTCVEEVCWHSNEEWVTTVLWYPETKCQCSCSIFISLHNQRPVRSYNFLFCRTSTSPEPPFYMHECVGIFWLEFQQNSTKFKFLLSFSLLLLPHWIRHTNLLLLK